MPERKVSLSDYRFGFNGKEKENTINGTANSLDYGARIYDVRIGRFISLDPDKEFYSKMSPYQGLNNNPINFIDATGKGATSQIQFNDNGQPYILVSSTVYIYTNDPNVNLNQFKTNYENGLNEAMNPCGNKDYLNDIPTNQISAPADLSNTLGVKTGQQVSLPIIFQTDVQVVEGGTQAAAELAQKTPKLSANFYEIYNGSTDAADYNSAEKGLINQNANRNVWVHERLHDMNWKENGETHSEDPSSIMNQAPGIENRPMREDDSKKINDGKPLKEKVGFGLPVKPDNN